MSQKGYEALGGSASADVLRKVKGLYEAGVSHPSFQRWEKEATEAWRFYDGAQWDDGEKSALQEKGQPAIVINKIATKIDNIAGSEVLGRTRMILRSRSGDATEEASARVLSDLLLYVGERNNQGLEVSAAFKAGLVSGIGWLDVGIEKGDDHKANDVGIFARAEDETQVVFDVSARRGDLSDARFVARARWLGTEELTSLFPKKAGQVIEGGSVAMSSAFGRYRDMLRQKADITYIDPQRELYKIVEVQYKKTAPFYEVVQADGSRFGTFSKNAAAAASIGGEMATVQKLQVRVAYFSGDVLLDDHALRYQHNRFTLVPFVFKRERTSGVPYGILRAAIDPQRELNKRRSKAMHLLSTAQVIADVDAVDDPEILAREAARPDGIILKRPGKDVRIIRNSDLAASQVSVMQEATRDIQDVLGVYDEAVGRESNAVSGVAIQQRQQASSLNQMFAFDALRKMKKTVGEMMLSLIRQYFTHEMVIQITDNLGAARVIRLNQPIMDEAGQPVVDADGNVQRLFDARQGTFDVHIEEVRDATSGRELELQQLQMLREAGVPVPAEVLVNATSISDKEKILNVAQREEA